MRDTLFTYIHLSHSQPERANAKYAESNSEKWRTARNWILWSFKWDDKTFQIIIINCAVLFSIAIHSITIQQNKVGVQFTLACAAMNLCWLTHSIYGNEPALIWVEGSWLDIQLLNFIREAVMMKLRTYAVIRVFSWADQWPRRLRQSYNSICPEFYQI